MADIANIPFWVLILITLWTLPWKGWALWLAAKRGDTWWFIVLLFLNTLAILEMVYIFVIVKKRVTKQDITSFIKRW